MCLIRQVIIFVSCRECTHLPHSTWVRANTCNIWNHWPADIRYISLWKKPVFIWLFNSKLLQRDWNAGLHSSTSSIILSGNSDQKTCVLSCRDPRPGSCCRFIVWDVENPFCQCASLLLSLWRHLTISKKKISTIVTWYTSMSHVFYKAGSIY